MSEALRRSTSRVTRRHPVAVTVTAASAALLLAACSGGSTGAKDAGGGSGGSDEGVTKSSVRIAYVGDLSGPDSGTELTYFKGMKAAIDVANKKGGAGGRKIELVTGDTKFDTAQAITEFKKYTTDDPALAILGINVSSMFEALDQRIKQEKVPVIGPTGVTQLTLDNPYVYQAQADLPTSAEAISKFMAAQMGGKPRVGVATISTASGDEWYDLFKKAAPQVGAVATGHQKIDPAAVEAAAQVAQFKKDKDTAVTLHSGGGGGIALVKSMVTGGLDVPLYSTFGANGPALWKAAGALASKVYAFDAFAPPESDVPGRADLEAAMKANGDWDELKDEKNYSEGWVIGNVVVDALDTAGSKLTRESFIQALQSTDGFATGGFSAPINWSENNGLADPSSIKAFTFDPKKDRIVEATTP
jgi:branched-chain amino acid transport system substrate-binding protein